MRPRWLLLVALLLLLPQLVQVPSTHDTGTAGLRVYVSPAIANAQLSGTAVTVQKRVVNFYQNGTGQFDGSSQVATFPTNFSSGNWSSLVSYVETFSPTATGGFYPQVNLTQGPDTLVNATATIPFGVVPGFNSTPVKQAVVELYTATGSLPSVGTYPVTTVASQQIQFLYSSPLNWTANTSAVYSASYALAAYPGYWLNTSQVFLPFPSVSTGVNWSTTSVTLNGTAYKNFQVVTGGIYVNVASVGRGYTATIGAKFTVLPAIAGAAPVLVVDSFTKFNATADQINASWTNNLNVAYAGEYLLQLDLPYTLNPASIIVQAGIRELSQSTWVLNGNTLTILPLVVDTPSAGAIAFFVTFSFALAPSQHYLSASTVALGSGGTEVTWGQLSLLGWIAAGSGAAFGFLAAPRLSRKGKVDWNNAGRWSVTLTVLALLLFGLWLWLELQAGMVHWP